MSALISSHKGKDIIEGVVEVF